MCNNYQQELGISASFYTKGAAAAAAASAAAAAAAAAAAISCLQLQSNTNLRHREQLVAGSAHLISNQITAVRSEQCSVRLDDAADLLTAAGLLHQSTELTVRYLNRLNVGQTQQHPRQTSE